MKIEFNKSPNFNEVRKRNIKYIIIHYTGMKTAKEALKRLKSKKYKVSSHYLIYESGKIIQLVNDKDIAWHAGVSYWQKDTNLNSKSIGIELQNKGSKYGYHSFKKSQINALIFLLKNLKVKHKIKIHNILGHSDIAPLRKSDPGYLFPWHKLAINGLAILPKKNNSNTLLKNSEIKLLQLLLRNFGYKISLSSLMDKETLQVIYAFESHYCPEELDEFRVKRKLLGYLRYLISIKRET
tara:strand:+ start:4281 stop:4997 length:717 start_codon:yes stop_codon:yes gene_type:complete